LLEAFVGEIRGNKESSDDFDEISHSSL